MASQVEIMNMAIVLLGEQRIASPSEDIKPARELSAVWDMTRQGLLRGYRWGFAMKRAALAALSTTPLHQYAYQFLMPSDCLRLDFVGDYFAGASLTDYRTSDESLWSIAATDSGSVIETDLPAPLNIRYVSDITNAARFDALFSQALAAKLAGVVAASLTKSATIRDQAAQAFGMAISQAVGTNAIERPPMPMADDSWILTRR